VKVIVKENNLEQSLRALKRKMQKEGLLREIKLRRYYEKPSEKRVRQEEESVRRYRKFLRKRLDREGY
jgi:small subunit ribosomal protein S21